MQDKNGTLPRFEYLLTGEANDDHSNQKATRHVFRPMCRGLSQLGPSPVTPDYHWEPTCFATVHRDPDSQLGSVSVSGSGPRPSVSRSVVWLEARCATSNAGHTTILRRGVDFVLWWLFITASMPPDLFFAMAFPPRHFVPGLVA